MTDASTDLGYIPVRNAVTDPGHGAQRASRERFDRQAACYGSGQILRGVYDVVAVLDGKQPSPPLDTATGAGCTAVYLAGRGIDVIAADISEGMLAERRKPTAGAHCKSRRINTPPGNFLTSMVRSAWSPAAWQCTVLPARRIFCTKRFVSCVQVERCS